MSAPSAASRSRRALGRGFTLIEVLVAVAILGLGLTAILTAQAGTFTSVAHAKNLSQASGLERCKVSEIEDDLQRNGFVDNDVSESGPCCDHADNFRMTCDWRVERLKLPDAKYGDLQLDKLDLSSPGGQTDALNSATKGKLDLPQNGNVSDVAESLAGGGNMADAATSILMSVAYPDLQQIFESGTRRITVTISWTEGSKTYTNEIVEWVTNARAAGVTSEIPGTDPADPDDSSGSTGSGAGSGSGSHSSGSGMNPFAPSKPRTEK